MIRATRDRKYEHYIAKRILATCRLGSEDLNRWPVRDELDWVPGEATDLFCRHSGEGGQSRLSNK
jgi:hypothetical protein